MKTLKDLGLRRTTRKIVEAWLQEWLTLFEEQADHRESWVYRCDFAKGEFYYHTNCRDINAKDPESTAVESNLAIRSRKRKIMLQLFLKTLLGRDLKLLTITCKQCTYVGSWINALKDGTGYWVFCPRCKKTDIHLFPAGYKNCINSIQEKIAQETKLQGFSPTPLIQEIKSYKLERQKIRR